MRSALLRRINADTRDQSRCLTSTKKRLHKVVVFRNIRCPLRNQRFKDRKLLIRHGLDAFAIRGRVAEHHLTLIRNVLDGSPSKIRCRRIWTSKQLLRSLHTDSSRIPPQELALEINRTATLRRVSKITTGNHPRVSRNIRHRPSIPAPRTKPRLRSGNGLMESLLIARCLSLTSRLKKS